MRADKAPETPQKNAHHNKKKKKESLKERSSIARKAADEFKGMMEQRKLLRRVRQDLERVRLLCELMRKREQRKRELIANHAEMTELKCWPFIVFLRSVMDNLQSVDQQDIFAEPVDLEDVPDYLDHIRHPMDFRTMRRKLDDFTYESVEQVEADFNLMVENCLSYNERDTIFFRAGVRMRDLGGSIIRQAKRTVESVGYDGFFRHDSDRKTSQPIEMSDEQIMKEIDNFLNEEDEEEGGDGEQMSDEDHLNRLLELQDKAQVLHHPVAKVKRLKLLKLEIIKIRRKLTLDKTGKRKEDGVCEDGGEPPSKKKKTREVSPAAEEEADTPGRRLRESKKTPGSATTTSTGTKRGKKRGRVATEPSETPPAKKKATSAHEDGSKTPTKAAALSSQSPTKSPAGVNRRNAVLFTRKKQAATASNSSSASAATEAAAASGATAAAATAAATATASAGDETKEENLLDEQETVVSATVSINASEATKKRSPTAAATKKSKEKKKRGRKAKGAGPSVEVEQEEEEEKGEEKAAAAEEGGEQWQQLPPKTASFQEYRRGGGEVGETDEDTQSESATDALISDEDDDDEDDDDDSNNDSDDDSDDSDDDGDGGDGSRRRIPLEPLDLVWAKCRGYPWYPALIINPKMPRTGYLHNGVPIPVPPQEVLDMAKTHTESHYLILFFDAKRTWQWLIRDKLEPLGVDSELDKAKLVQGKKPAERKAVKKAYEDAIMHRCKVTGENASISGDEEEEEEGEEGNGSKKDGQGEESKE